MQERMSCQNQYVLSIKKRLPYIASAILVLSLLIGFQNCSDKNSQTLPQENDPDPIAELSIQETKHPDLLEISSSVKGQIQDDFAEGSTVDLSLSPSNHQNLQGNKSFYWTVDNYAWDTPFYSGCSVSPGECTTDADGSVICTSGTSSCTTDPNPPIYENMATGTPNAQYEFLDVGVYDIRTEIREVPVTTAKSSDGSVAPRAFVYSVYGPEYERSLVIGKCDQGDLQIVNSQDPIQNVPPTTSTTQIVNSITSSITTNDYFYGYGYGQASRYASTFMLELDGDILDPWSPYYDISVPDLPSVTPGNIELESQKSEEKGVDRLSIGRVVEEESYVYPEERKVRWKLMAEMVDPTYGRWYYRFSEQQTIAAWYMPWPEDNVRYFYGASGITSETKFSGKFILEAFVQLPGEECVYSAKKAFQLSGNLIPSVEIGPSPSVLTTLPDPGGGSVPSTSTSTTQGL